MIVFNSDIYIKLVGQPEWTWHSRNTWTDSVPQPYADYDTYFMAPLECVKDPPVYWGTPVEGINQLKWVINRVSGEYGSLKLFYAPVLKHTYGNPLPPKNLDSVKYPVPSDRQFEFILYSENATAYPAGLTPLDLMYVGWREWDGDPNYIPPTSGNIIASSNSKIIIKNNKIVVKS